MPPDQPTEKGVRLQKVLAAAGYGSRRKCEELITEGRVTVDGETADDLGVRVDPQRQDVRVDGDRVKPERKKYYVLNKPAGYVCTHRDPAGRPRAIDLMPDGPRLFTVGRLDENSTGLLLVTNDGELANRLAHPRYQVPRRYRVQVAGRPTADTFKQLREGVWFAEGKFYVTDVKPIRRQGQSTILEIELRQGRNREIRRMFARLGHKVMHLERVTFGPVKLGSLTIGKYRPLRDKELDALRDMMRRQKGDDTGTEDGPKPRRPGHGKRSGPKKAGPGKPGPKKTGPKKTGSTKPQRQAISAKKKSKPSKKTGSARRGKR